MIEPLKIKIFIKWVGMLNINSKIIVAIDIYGKYIYKLECIWFY